MLNRLGPQPRLAVMDGAGHLSLTNRAEEQLPSAVEINGGKRSHHVAAQEELDEHKYPHRAVFVYESAGPHLRLRWEWLARADFGPVEHRIIIENLGDKEVWLPMVDSLRSRLQRSGRQRSAELLCGERRRQLRRRRARILIP